MKSILIESVNNPEIIFIMRGNGEECRVDISKGTISTWSILSASETKLINLKIRQRAEDLKR